jgi:hypothetical protein
MLINRAGPFIALPFSTTVEEIYSKPRNDLLHKDDTYENKISILLLRTTFKVELTRLFKSLVELIPILQSLQVRGMIDIQES